MSGDMSPGLMSPGCRLRAEGPWHRSAMGRDIYQLREVGKFQRLNHEALVLHLKKDEGKSCIKTK